MNGRSADMAVTRAAGINAKSPHWREALHFLQYLASPQYSDVIVQDGDSLPPDPALGTGERLKNEMVPDPAFHQPFVDQMKFARPLVYSPYIDATETTRWMQETVDKVENRIQSPADAMRSIAAQINSTIKVNLDRRPDLRRRLEGR
jgi:ABC-type glycerol-3-phosphate transport system substrate-binding protein